jgi:hypothetical protein
MIARRATTATAMAWIIEGIIFANVLAEKIPEIVNFQPPLQPDIKEFSSIGNVRPNHGKQGSLPALKNFILECFILARKQLAHTTQRLRNFLANSLILISQGVEMHLIATIIIAFFIAKRWDRNHLL